jgi:hypothetical protein
MTYPSGFILKIKNLENKKQNFKCSDAHFSLSSAICALEKILSLISFAS